MSLSGKAIDLFIPNHVPHVIVRRERDIDKQTLCEEIHIYFNNDEPVVEVVREFAG